jgi:hypothetical protein
VISACGHPYQLSKSPARLGPRAKKGVSAANYTGLIDVPNTGINCP